MKHVMGPKSLTTLSATQKGDAQPNACDLRLGKVYTIHGDTFEISNESKKHRSTTELQPGEDGYYDLPVGQYEVTMENLIDVGSGEAGWIVARSSLTRNGLFICSGIYDSEYTGIIGGVLHVTNGHARIKRGTRVAQYVSFDAEMLHGYDGDYGFDENGNPKGMEAKYHQ